MKTVFFLTKNFPPLICGVGDYTYELFRRLKAEGYQVRIITQVNEEVKDFIAGTEMENEVYPVISKWNILSIRKILNLLRKERANLFCIQYVPYSYHRFGMPFLLILLQFCVRLNGIKTGIFFHEVAVRTFFQGFKIFVLSIAQRLIAYFLFIISDFSLTSNVLYQTYFKPFRIHVVPIPANLYGANEVLVDRNHGIGRAKMRFASFANRCNKQVVEAIAYCVNSDKLNIEFFILGYRSRVLKETLDQYIVTNMIGSHVFYDTNTSKYAVAGGLYESDVFLQIEYVSERGEGGISSKSGVTAAAMAAGLPIIGSRGDMTDMKLFKHEDNMLFIDSPSAESIRSSIHRLYSNQNLRISLSENSKNTYVLYFSWAKTVNSYIREFNQT